MLMFIASARRLRRPGSYKLLRRFATMPSRLCDLIAEIIFHRWRRSFQRNESPHFRHPFVRSNARRLSSA